MAISGRTFLVEWKDDFGHVVTSDRVDAVSWKSALKKATYDPDLSRTKAETIVGVCVQPIARWGGR